MQHLLPAPPDFPGLLEIITPLRSLVSGAATLATVAACLGFIALFIAAGILRRDIVPSSYADTGITWAWWAAGLGTLVTLMFGGVFLGEWGYLGTIAGTLGVLIVAGIALTVIRRRRW